MSKIKTRVRSLTSTVEQENKFEQADKVFAETNKPYPIPASERRSMAVARIIYDETGDLMLQLRKLCGNSPFVVQHDHAGWYVQVQEWKDVGSEAAAQKSNWQPVTGIHYDLRATLEEAIKNLVKKHVVQPPDPTPVMEVITPSTVNQDAVKRALEAADEPAETPTFDDVDELEVLLGEKVSAQKKNAKGGLSPVVAGTLVLKSFSTDTGEEYGVEYKDSSGHKRSIAVRPETIVPVPKGLEATKPLMKEDDNLGGPISSVASIVAEF